MIIKLNMHIDIKVCRYINKNVYMEEVKNVYMHIEIFKKNRRPILYFGRIVLPKYLKFE